jgi:hypothetical protein
MDIKKFEEAEEIIKELRGINISIEELERTLQSTAHKNHFRIKFGTSDTTAYIHGDVDKRELIQDMFYSLVNKKAELEEDLEDL